MILFLKFLLAHILGDFVFQSESWVLDKEKKKVKSVKLYFHIGIHAFLVLLILQFNLYQYLSSFTTLLFLISSLNFFVKLSETKKFRLDIG